MLANKTEPGDMLWLALAVTIQEGIAADSEETAIATACNTQKCGTEQEQQQRRISVIVRDVGAAGFFGSTW